MKNLRAVGFAILMLAGAGQAAANSLLPKLPWQTDRAEPAPVVQVQSGDQPHRVGQLEEQIRAMNGRIEELGFQLLQMEEKIRQMQEDNEFRFQQLEGGGSASGNRTDASPAVTEEMPMDHAGDDLPGVEDTATASTNHSGSTGAPPRALGTIIFDENGNSVGGAAGELPAGSATAALDNAADLYQAGYSHILAGDYQLAEQMFRDFVDIYPNEGLAPDAMFWLGESQYSQGRYNDAAKTFLSAHERFPKSDKAADTMLKLGMSLAALDKREPACATYRKLLTNYPGASAAVRDKVSREQVKASC